MRALLLCFTPAGVNASSEAWSPPEQWFAQTQDVHDLFPAPRCWRPCWLAPLQFLHSNPSVPSRAAKLPHRPRQRHPLLLPCRSGRAKLSSIGSYFRSTPSTPRKSRPLSLNNALSSATLRGIFELPRTPWIPRECFSP